MGNGSHWTAWYSKLSSNFDAVRPPYCNQQRGRDDLWEPLAWKEHPQGAEPEVYQAATPGVGAWKAAEVAMNWTGSYAFATMYAKGQSPSVARGQSNSKSKMPITPIRANATKSPAKTQQTLRDNRTGVGQNSRIRGTTSPSREGRIRPARGEESFGGLSSRRYKLKVVAPSRV